MSTTDTIATIPTFARVEIRIKTKGDLTRAAYELKALSAELETLYSQGQTDEATMILAHHKIRSTSKMLRGAT